MKRLLLALFFFFFLFSPDRSNSFPAYSIIDLGDIAESETTASAINNSGVIVGSIGHQEGAFKWENGETTILPFLADLPEAGAISINDNDEIVGFSPLYNWHHAVMWDSENDINDLGGAGFANDINESSQIVIESWGSYESFLWEDGSVQVIASTDLNSIDHSAPNAINENGQVVGWGYTFGGEDDYRFAYLWEDESLYDLNDLITNNFDGTLHEAIDINNNGQIVGDSWLFEDGNVLELDFSASSINEIGQVVGNNYLYEDGDLYNLNELIESEISYTDLEANDINDLGQIVGSFNLGGETHAFLMNPISFTVAYSAGGNGSIIGQFTQIVEHGESTTEVTAAPDTGYYFVNWTGDYESTDNPLTITNVTSDMDMTANFAINTYTVEFSPGDHGGLSGDFNQIVEYGGSCTQITVYPGEGYEFVNWSGDHTGDENPLTLENISSDMIITATYVLSYDGNNDGIPDAEQYHVKNLTAEDYQSITLVFSEFAGAISYGLFDNPSPEDTPDGIDFPYGFFNFTVEDVEIGETTTVTIYLPDGAAPDTYYKYGSTLDNRSPHWYEFLYDGTTGAEITGNVIRLYFVDGGRGDDDLIANGIVVDDGGPGVLLSLNPDSNVDSIQAYGSDESVSLESPAGTILSNCRVVDNPSPSDSPTDIDFPYGLFGFIIDGVVPGGITSMTLTLPDGAEPGTYYKYGPTPDNTSNHWYEFMHDGETGAIINGNKITLYFVDGKRGDSDLDGTNGIIVDPGGPSIVDTSNLPAVTTSGDGGGGSGCFIGNLTQQ